MPTTYTPGQRLGLSSLLVAMTVVARIVAEFGPRIRAAFPDVPALITFLTACETAAALLLPAKEAFEVANSPIGEADDIDWNDLPGKVPAV